MEPAELRNVKRGDIYRYTEKDEDEVLVKVLANHSDDENYIFVLKPLGCQNRKIKKAFRVVMKKATATNCFESKLYKLVV
jgi:hypothetical protein